MIASLPELTTVIEKKYYAMPIKAIPIKCAMTDLQ